MKTLALLLINFFPLLSQVAKINNDFKNRNLRGDIKFIIETEYSALPNLEAAEKGKFENKEECIYNEKGYQIEKNSYHFDRYGGDSYSTIDSKMKFTYDERSNMIEASHFAEIKSTLEDALPKKITRKYDNRDNLIEEKSYSKDGRLNNKYVYVYDDKNNWIEEAYYVGIWGDQNITEVFPLELQNKITRKFDDNGNLIERAYYTKDGARFKNIDGTTESKITFKYDNKNNLIERAGYRFSWKNGDILENKCIYKYDDKGNQIEENKYSYKNTLKTTTDNKGNKKVSGKLESQKTESKITFKYDDRKNIIEQIYYLPNPKETFSLSYKITFKYDNKGYMIEKSVFNSSEKLGIKIVWKYDDKGNIIEYNEYNADNLISTQTYTFDYDKTGNWIKKNEAKNGESIKTIEREIKYY